VTVLAASGRGRSVFDRNVANQVGAFDSAANVSCVIPRRASWQLSEAKQRKTREEVVNDVVLQ
jgi:hypothetical protein